MGTSTNGKQVILVEDDDDDYHFFLRAAQQIAPELCIVRFTQAQAALDYLTLNTSPIFLIISEIKLSGSMSGLELRSQLEADKKLKQKSIPFLFMSDPVPDALIKQAYDMTVQGVFQKPASQADFEQMLSTLVGYWTYCLHPNR